MTRPRQRWITAGWMKPQFIVAGGSGFPGLTIRWTGRSSWCQPHDFQNWKQLMAAIRIRLGIAKLELVTVAVAISQTDGACQVLVLVRRASRIPGG